MAGFRALSLAALAGVLPFLVQGIALDAPSSPITKGSEITATWTTVDTDPSIFSLYLWNFVQWPPYYEGLAYGVDTTAGKATVRIPCHIDNGEGWQLTAINNTNVYVLYSQSSEFNITGDACADPATTAACYAPPQTVYVTAPCTGAATVPPTTATGVATAQVILPGVVDGTATAVPTVAPTTAPAAIPLLADVLAAL